MKILLTVFTERPLSRWQHWRAHLLLARRKRHLEAQGCTALSLGVTGDLNQAATSCRVCEADGLWISIADGGRALRRQYFRNPTILEGLAVYADGIVGPHLPPTPGQLRQMTAMGITYLSDDRSVLLPLLLEYA